MLVPFSRSTLACAVLACSLPAFANDTVQLQNTVVSASGFEQKITEAPASISVITQQDLQEKRYNSLAHALSDVEGIDVGQATGKTGGLNISIRGLPSEYTLILIDGRRQNTAGNTTPNGFGETSTSFIPPMNSIERIEIIRGPMSTLYGSDAMGGVINIITRKIDPEWTGSISQDYTYQEDRDYGDTRNTNIYTSGPLIDNLLGVQVRGNFFNREESTIKTPQGTALNRRGGSPVEGQKFNIGSRLTLTPNENNDFSLDLERGRQSYNNDDCQLGNLDGTANGGSGSGGCATKADRANGYSDKLIFERDQYVLSHTGRFDLVTLESSLTRTTTETIGRTIPGGNLAIGTPHPNNPSVLIGSKRQLENTSTIFDSKLITELNDSNTTNIGVQWWHSEMKDGIATEKFEQTTKSLFAENEWRIRDNLALTLGGRYDHHDAFGSNFSPRAYLVWNTNTNWTVKGGVSQGYKTPSLNDLHSGINGVTSQGVNLTIGNPDLKPETSTSSELGVYFDSLESFSANATIFHNKFKDKIETGPDDIVIQAGNPNIPAGTYSQDINIGEAVSQGLELGANWAFAPSWNLGANYTYTESSQESGVNKGAPLTSTPKHIANAKLKWQASDDMSLWLISEYRGERERFQKRSKNFSTAEQNIVSAMGSKTKAYNLLHLGGSYQLTQDLSLNATIYNLLDKDFSKGRDIGTAYVTDYATSTNSISGTFEERRRLWMSATYQF